MVHVVHGWGDNVPATEVFREAFAETLKDVDVEVVGTNTSVTNVLMLSRREADVAFTFSDAAYMASVGQIPEMPKPFVDIRAIAELPTRALQILVGPRSSIRTISQLRGRHVSLGPPGSGAALTSAFVLSGFGISLDDVTAERLEFREGADKVVSGDLDAAFWNGTFPNSQHRRGDPQGRTAARSGGPRHRAISRRVSVPQPIGHSGGHLPWHRSAHSHRRR